MTGWLQLSCSFCLSKFRIKESYAHLRGRCPACGFRIKAPRPLLHSDRPMRVSDADEPQGLIEEEGEWPEPALLVTEEEFAEYRLSQAPPSAVPPAPEPAGSADVFSLAPEYKPARPVPGEQKPVGQPPIRLAGGSPAASTKPQSFDEFVAGAKQARTEKPAPSAPPRPAEDDVPFAEATLPRKPVAPQAAPAEPGRPFDPLLDDILVPAPPKPEPAKPAPSTGPKFTRPSEPSAAAPAEKPAPAEAEPPVIGIYNFKDAPAGVSTAALAAEGLDEFAHIKPAPQVAPLSEPEWSTTGTASPRPPPVARLAPEPAEVKPASQEELYQYRLSEAERQPYRPPKPPDSPLWTGVWNFAWQASSVRMLVWLILGCTVLAVQFALLGWGVGEWQEGSKLAAGLVFVFVGVSAAIVVLLLGSYAAACFFKVIEETAAGENEIASPEGGLALSIGVWAGQLVRLGFLMLCGLIACGLFGFCLGSLYGTILLLFLWPAVFNTFLLSAMAADSWWKIIHGKVLEKLGEKTRVLLALYAWTFVLLAIVLGAWWLIVSVWPGFALLAGPALAVCCLTYARVVGRVGLLITTDESKGKKKRKKRKRRPVSLEPSGEIGPGSDPADEPPGVQSQAEGA